MFFWTFYLSKNPEKKNSEDWSKGFWKFSFALQE